MEDKVDVLDKPTLNACSSNQSPKETDKLIDARRPPPIPYDQVRRPGSCSPSELEQRVFKIITESLQLYKPNEVIVCFNGGKDCTVLLHILTKFFHNRALRHIKLPVLYIAPENGFPEMENFVNDCAKMYNIKLMKHKGSLKPILDQVCKKHPEIRAAFMGCRRTDPHCRAIQTLQATDPDWPPLMRINPLLEWTYTDIWNYIFAYNVPYCSLYDAGYTSLGDRTNTFKNPFLKRRADEKLASLDGAYRPAHELEEDNLERAGRGPQIIFT